VHTRGERIDKVKKQGDDQHNSVPGSDILEAVGAIII
jgi:hypothetical protein